MIKNRLIKNKKRLEKIFKRKHVTAYRVYNHDIPEFPYFIDIYNDTAILYDRRNPEIDFHPSKHGNHEEILAAIKEIWGTPPIVKVRTLQKRTEKYKKTKEKEELTIIEEGELKFLVNLNNFIDTGLFLDHRPWREHFQKTQKAKKVLNLFSYTCSLSVACAKSGAHVTSVDLSKNYLNWGKENFKINNISYKDEDFIASDILETLDSFKESSFDTIILDPPTFSNSKKMKSDLDIQRDHPQLLYRCLRLLKDNGTIYFSNNKLGFKNTFTDEHFHVVNTTEKTIPEDFKNSKIHQSFEVKKINL